MSYLLQVIRKLLLPSIFLFVYSQAPAQVLARSQSTMATHQIVGVPASTVMLRDVLIQLKSQYQVNILFEDRLVNQPVNPSLIEHNATLEQNLTRILQPSDLRFRKVSEGVYVIVKNRKAKNNVIPAPLNASDNQDASANIPDASRVVHVPLESIGSKGKEAADERIIQGRVTDEKGGGSQALVSSLKTPHAVPRQTRRENTD